MRNDKYLDQSSFRAQQ